MRSLLQEEEDEPVTELFRSELVTHIKSWEDKRYVAPNAEFQMFGRAQYCTRTLSVLVGSPASYPFPVSCPLESTKPWDQVPALELPLPKQYYKVKAQHFVVESDFSSQRTVPSYMHCGLAQPSTSITCNSTAALHPASQYTGASKDCLLPFLAPYSFHCNCPHFGTQSFLHPSCLHQT